MADRDDISTLLSGRESLLQVFFYLLWQKMKNKHCLTHISLPDTVILNHSRAIDWYFTSKDGSIKKKSRQKLSSNTIVEHFNKHGKSKSGANAMLIRRDPSKEEGVTCEPIPHSRLRTLLADGVISGTLQLFVDPKAESGVTSNHEIVTSWTPNVFYVEKRSNSTNLFSEKIPLEDRTAVTETSRFVRVAPLVSSRTTSQLEMVCQTIAQHIEGIHGARVAHLGLHTRIDDKDNVWILYCSSIRVCKIDPPSTSSLTLAAPKQSPRREDPVKPMRRPSLAGSGAKAVVGSKAVKKEVICNLCRKETKDALCTHIAQKHVLFPLAVMSFISSHAPGTPFEEEQLADDEVPAHVQLLHPDMTGADYKIMRSDPQWDDNMVNLCQNCTAGLESITTSLDIGVDGAIRVPDNTTGQSSHMATATSASRRNPNHEKPMSRMKHHVSDFSYGKQYQDAEAWEEDSQASDNATLYNYDEDGNAVSRNRTVAPARRQNNNRSTPSPAPRPAAQQKKLAPIQDKNKPIDPKKLNKALNKVTPVTQGTRRQNASSRSNTPNRTPNQ